VNAARKKLLRALDVNSHAAGGILGVGERKVDALTLNDARNQFTHGSPRWATDDISKNQNSHRPVSRHLA
jgi:hypothetical protein